MDEGLLLVPVIRLVVVLTPGRFPDLVLELLALVLDVLHELWGALALLDRGETEERAILGRDLLAGIQLVIGDEDTLDGADDRDGEQHARNAPQSAADEDGHEDERRIDVDGALHEFGRDDVAHHVIDDHVDHDGDDADERRDEERDDRDDCTRDHGADVGHEIQDAAQEAQHGGVGNAHDEEDEPARDARDERAEDGRLRPAVEGRAKGVGHDIDVVLVLVIYETAQLACDDGQVEKNPKRADKRDEGDEDDVAGTHEAAHDAGGKAACQGSRLVADEGPRLPNELVDALSVDEGGSCARVGDEFLYLVEVGGKLLRE